MFLTWSQKEKRALTPHSIPAPKSMTELASSAKNATRDLNPNDNMKNLRIKTGKKELIVSNDKDFIVVVIQAWEPAREEESHKLR